ncbi:TIGR04211 family SH3 domain-containing protein [Halomonas shantousis]
MSFEEHDDMRRIKHVMIGLALGALALNSSAQAQSTRWVADDLTTFVRSGPTDEYRIVGTLTSGDRVALLESSGDYSRVRGEDGEAVWVLTRDLQETQSVQERLPELQSRVETLSAELEGINDEWERRVSTMTDTLEVRQERIAELESRNVELDRQSTQAAETIRRLQARLDTQEQDLLMRYFMYGGGVAGAGLILGLIVPHLPRRRKRRDRWF